MTYIQVESRGMTKSPMSLNLPSLNLLAGIILSAFLLSGCSIFGSSEEPLAAGHEAQFAKPVDANAPIAVTASEVSGHRVQITDEQGPFWLNLHQNRKVEAGIGPDQYVSDGTWHVNKAGQLCLRSSVWWQKGTCFVMLGGTSFATATRIHSLSAENGPNAYYPFRILGPIS